MVGGLSLVSLALWRLPWVFNSDLNSRSHSWGSESSTSCGALVFFRSLQPYPEGRYLSYPTLYSSDSWGLVGLRYSQPVRVTKTEIQLPQSFHRAGFLQSFYGTVGWKGGCGGFRAGVA